MADVSEASTTRVVPPGATRMRFPKLFALVVLLFLLDLVVPDFIPMADEIILGVLSVMLGILREKRPEVSEDEGTGPTS